MVWVQNPMLGREGVALKSLRHLGATLSSAKRGTIVLDHISHSQPAGSPDVPQERLKSRLPFVPAAPKLLNDLLMDQL